MTAADWRKLTKEERVLRVAGIVSDAVKGTAVSDAVVLGIINKESQFYPDATAKDERDLARGGAFGLMQMTYQTAKGLGFTASEPGDRAKLTGLYDPVVNIRLGVLFLSQLLKAANGNVTVAISAYNAGLSAERAGDAKRKTNDPNAPIINQPYVDEVADFARNVDVMLALTVGFALVVVPASVIYFASKVA